MANCARVVTHETIADTRPDADLSLASGTSIAFALGHQSMRSDDLLHDLDPGCPALNELCGRVEDQVKASGLRGRTAYQAEVEQLTPLRAPLGK